MPGENIWDSCHILKRRAAFYDKINEYFEDGTYTDVNIVCQNRVFKCHKLILAAASEYFHVMFRGNFAESHAQDVVLHEFDSVTFEQILLFVYKGEIAVIDDNNVFNLLRASDVLQLNDLEYFCVHHLTQKNIPMGCALEIYLFASASRKVALIPALSRFILQNLDHFSRESKFLQMSFEDFSALLTYFEPSSASRDTTLLNAILGWVCRSTDVHQNRKLCFIELAQKVKFETVSTAHIAEYFDRNSIVNNDMSRRSEVSIASNLDPSMETDDLSLHVYIGTGVTTSNVNGSEFYYIERTVEETAIFSLQGNALEGIDWHRSHTIRPGIEKMRIIESDGRLYYLKFYNRMCTFGSSTASDLCTDMQSLVLPSGLSSMDPISLACTFSQISRPLSLCSLRKNIYLGGLHDIDVQCYNTERGMWSPIPVLSKYERKSLMNDDARLYIFSTGGSSLFAAYDPRVGKVEELNHKGLDRAGDCTVPGTYHKGKIYFTNDYVNVSTIRMAIYDPTAGRWDVQYLDYKGNPVFYDRRIVSFNNGLWIFTLGSDSIYTHIYDSYLQKWNGVYRNKLIFKDSSHPRRPHSHLGLPDLTDVVVYKSS